MVTVMLLFPTRLPRRVPVFCEVTDMGTATLTSGKATYSSFWHAGIVLYNLQTFSTSGTPENCAPEVSRSDHPARHLA